MRDRTLWRSLSPAAKKKERKNPPSNFPFEGHVLAFISEPWISLDVESTAAYISVSNGLFFQAAFWLIMSWGSFLSRPCEPQHQTSTSLDGTWKIQLNGLEFIITWLNGYKAVEYIIRRAMRGGFKTLVHLLINRKSDLQGRGVAPIYIYFTNQT